MTSKQDTQRKNTLTAAHNDYEKSLNAHAFFKVHDHQVGEDMVQETFFKTWKYLVRGGKIEIMRAFLFHILNHLIVDEYRKRKSTSLDTLVEDGFEPSEDNSGRLFNFIDGKKAISLIKELPEKYRKVMHMRYVQELTLKEMSLITGQTRNAMAVQLHRGMDRLKLLYNPASL